jgi:hypothetical protein
LGPFKLNTAADWAELVKSNSVRALSLAGMRYRVAVFCSSTAIMKPDSAMAHVGKGFELFVVVGAPEEPAGEAVELETSEVEPIEEADPGVELLPSDDCAAPELDAAELLPDVDDAAPEPEATELPAAELDTSEVEKELADDDGRLELEAANEVLEQAPPETVTVPPPTVSVEVTVEGSGGGMTTVVVVVSSCVTVRVSMSVTSRVAAGCVIVIAAAVSVIVRVSVLVISRVAAGCVTVIAGAVIVTVSIEVMSAVIPGPVITSVIAAGVTETVVVPLYTV